ncbi:Cellobiose dehydrogenase [Paramyrothecium foliicola]|nr:Cellobiose dehydrogenase [Paramyrothecium foliicola]
MRFSAITVAGLLPSVIAISDLDGSVWKALDNKQQSGAASIDRLSNRPYKRQSGWNPPSDLAKPLKEVWDHYVSTYDGGVEGNKNWGWHQVIRNKGSLNICVRWDSKATITEAERNKVATTYNAQYQKWFKWLYGFDGFPYSEVKVNVVGWAVRDKSLLQGATDGIDVYTDVDPDGVPMCAIGCAGEAHLDGDYSGCAGGAASHYDHSLWLTDGLEGGFGYSWGQQVGREYFMNNIDSESIHILLHEMGHTFALDDFYDWTPSGVSNFIMLAGSSMEITDFDGWMYRNWWHELSQLHGWSSAKDSADNALPTATLSPEPKPTSVEETPTQPPAAVETSDEAPVPVDTTEPTPEPVPEPEPAAPVDLAEPVVADAVQKWGQCGGASWTGSTSCASGLTCNKYNEYYSQCLKQLLSAVSLGLGLFGSCRAQQSTTFTDPETGITYQQVTQGSYSFGIALPEGPGTDFIGRISAESTVGWAGVSLGGRMVNSLMVVAWPNENEIVSSLRRSTGYASPSVYSGTASLKIIPAGTRLDGSALTFTFLCEGCIQTDGSTFTSDVSPATLGYGLAAAAVSSPADPASRLTFHSAGFGLFSIDLAAARSADFAEWAALAEDTDTPPEVPPGDGGGNPNPGNGTVPISNSTYDYIVVGGGPAGLVTSQRLTETGRSVLLIERGMASTASTGGTRLVPWNQSLTYYDVPGLFRTLPVATLGEGYCTDTAAVAGCVLGGGGSVNGMAFIHPPSWDFDDNWPEGWKWADVESAAARLYARNPGTTLPSADGKYYDTGVSDVLTPWLEKNGWTFADGIEEPDAKIQSYGPPSLNIAGGLRSGPIHTYLPLAQAKSNFKLQLNTKVIRVLRNNSTMTGVEVETAQGRQIINLKPGGGVILAAGVMSTPRVLFNSGIGPSEQINTVKSGTTGVTLPPESDWINLPVGVEVKDHSRYEFEFDVPGGLTTYSDAQLANPSEADIEAFHAGNGVLTQSFQRIDTFRQVQTSDGHNIMFQTHLNSIKNNSVSFMLLMSHGLTSRGTLAINAGGSTFFTKEPWTNTDTDREAWALAINELLDMARKPDSPLVFSGGKNATAAFVLSGPVQPGIHMVGTTKMGTDDGRNNGTAVVDLNNKVYGTDNLYVVDASFHPDLPTGNTQAIVMVAAEHAIKRIIAERGLGGLPCRRRVRSVPNMY